MSPEVGGAFLDLTSLIRTIPNHPKPGIQFRDINIKREPRAYMVQAAYEARVYYIGNIYLLAVFDTSVNIQR